MNNNYKFHHLTTSKYICRKIFTFEISFPFVISEKLIQIIIIERYKEKNQNTWSRILRFSVNWPDEWPITAMEAEELPYCVLLGSYQVFSWKPICIYTLKILCCFVIIKTHLYISKLHGSSDNLMQFSNIFCHSIYHFSALEQLARFTAGQFCNWTD